MIDKRIIEEIVEEQLKEIEIKRKGNYCRRDEEALVDLSSPLAQVVTGIRRSGKSTLCFNALNNAGLNFAYINFDDERFEHIESEDLNHILEVLYKVYGDFEYLFMDEVQNAPGWHLFVNRLLRRNIKIIVTGSNANLLSGELATHLTGRHSVIKLFPFSYKDFAVFNKVNIKSKSTENLAARRACFDTYLSTGGFPELLHLKSPRGYISTLVDNIIKRDIEQRYRISYVAAFEQLTHHLLNNAPCIISLENLSKEMSIKSLHTIKNYLNYLKEAYLLIGIQKYSPKSRTRVIGEKVYPIDVALMNNRENAFAGENLGWRLETVVLIELLRKEKPYGQDVYYYSDRSSECDFVICHGNTVKQCIQVSYDISNPKTFNREISSLVRVANKLKCTSLTLLTDNVYKDEEKDGFKIKVRPVYDWVLGNTD